MSSSLRAIVVCATLLCAGCWMEPTTCRGPVATHPAGKCSARYYQTDFHDGRQISQALVECADLPTAPGGNIVTLHSAAHGIGLKWLSANTLEVAVPSGIPLRDQRTIDEYGGYRVRYVYRELKDREPAASGCGLDHF